MSDDLPYKAEYAKSGRAGCKGCKTTIAQGSLRIAKMVQSSHFDGKVPNWFHHACFFKKYKPKSSTDIDKFDDLRWDDQEKVKSNISGGDNAPDKDEVDGAPSALNGEYEIEYSKSSRAKCRECIEKIEKGVIRIAKMMESEDSRYPGLVPHWHHVDCFIKRRTELDAENIGAADIPGFNTLKKEDQKEVAEKVGKSKKSKKGKETSKKAKPLADEKPENNTNTNGTLELKLKKQSKRYWTVRDGLYKSCSNQLLRCLLEVNDCNTTGGESELLDRVTDGIMFGALKKCPECKEGRLKYRSTGYTCTGNISGWTRCLYTTFSPERKLWDIPEEYKEDNELLSSFKVKVRERVFPESAKEALKNSQKDEAESSTPLDGKTIVIVGRLRQNKATIKQKIEELGGELVSAPSATCFCCISSPGEVMKGTKKMESIEENNIPVVTEDYLDNIKKGGAQLMISQYAIAPWGGDRDMDVTDGASKSSRKRKAGKSSSSETVKKTKLTMKGGAVVDTDSELDDCCHVLTHMGQIFSAVLGQVDLTRGTNSYYKLQILEHDSVKHSYFVFRSWGRVGTTIGGNKLESFDKREDAKYHFFDLYEEKTGNSWYNRNQFVKYPYKFYPIDIDYGQDEDMVQNAANAGANSILSKPVQELMKLIFDIEAMKHTLVEFEIDLKKMPLGKLSKKQIEAAYTCLTECQKLLADGIDSGSKVLDASNRFFTLIPHDFGMKKPPLINNLELLNGKIKMLDSLLEIEIAYSLMKGGGKGDKEKDQLDLHYESLKTKIFEISKESEEFKMINEYVQNTHAKTHSSYSLEVMEVFTIERDGEKKRYKQFRDFHNRKLLWHGSRATNYAGILSQGLRIAPPEAPVTGYMFGKGVYFADMASKSANYCHASSSKNTGLMLLCEVALGTTYDLTAAKHITKLPAGKHSCKGLGQTAPDPASDKTLPDGVVVPLGNGKSTDTKKSSLLYNEFIVYDTAQINIKYLVKLDFKYKYRS